MTAGSPIETVRIARRPQPDRRLTPRRLATLVTAGAVALSLVMAAALPARAADRDDLAKALIAALVIGAIIHETKKDDPPAPAAAPEPVHRKTHKKHWKDHDRRVPAVCALEFDGEHRNVTVYPERCLRRVQLDRNLPVHCAHEARIFGKWDRIYGERCLREAGFALPGEDHWRD